MTWSASADVSRFEEALAWFLRRFPATEDQKRQMEEHAQASAWTIAGVTDLNILQAVFDSIAAAIDKGETINEWREGLETKLGTDWSGITPHRLETVFINATQQAYNAGRWRQINDPVVKTYRPYGMFDGIADHRQSKICIACDGTILPLDHPWWQTHTPQLHHRCRSSVRSLTATQAARRGVTTDIPDTDASEGFGRAPGQDTWGPDPTKYDADLFATYDQKQAQLRGEIRPQKI